MGLHGGDIWNLEESHGLTPEEVLDFSSNINPLGVPQTVKRLLAEQPQLALRYPDPEYGELRQGLADWLGLSPGQVAVGNGASELIRELLLVLKPKRVMVPVPGFAEYARAAANLNIEVVGHRLNAEKDYQLQAEALQSDLELHRPDLVFLCNPNNPTGAQTGLRTMLAAQQLCLRAGAWLVVDETFLELSRLGTKASLVPFFNQGQLIVLRAFTKLFALPGLRLGYLASSEDLALRIRNSLVPWSVNGFAAKLGNLHRDEAEYLAQTARWIAQEPDWLYQQLEALAQHPGSPFDRFWRPDVNFLLGRLKTPQTAAWLRQTLLGKGILIRDCGNFAGLGPEYFRVAVKNRQANQRLVAELALHSASGG